MDVRLPDGTVIQNVPDGTTKDQLRAKLSAAGHDIHKMGLGPTSDDIPLAPGAKERIAADAAKPKAPDDNLLGKVFGAVEVPITMATGAIGGLVGGLAGAGKTLISGKYGTQAGVREGDEFGGKVAQALTYQPRTQTGNALVRSTGEALNDSGIVGIPIPEMNALGRGMASSTQSLRTLAAPSAAAMASQDASQAAGGGSLRNLLAQPKPAMTGVGAANTGEAAIRAQRAASMPVPIPLTKGQLERTFEQVRFEREAAKTPEGQRLNDHFAEQNRLMGQNMEALVDQTGAQASSLTTAGKTVRSAVDAKAAAKEAQIKAAYKDAREAGHMSETIDVSDLAKYVEENKGKDKLAPIISVIESELKQNAKVIGGDRDALMNPRPRQTVMDLNAAEDLRQAIGKLSEPGTPNVVYGSEAKKLIDAATENKGGPLFQQARRQYENYMNEFGNRDVIDKLLRTKPGTKDYAVANEDVMKHALLNGSTDDVRHVFRVLTAHAKDSDPAIVQAGTQAAAELRGALTNHIKEQMFSNAGADTMGNVVGSEAKLKRIINELDKDGKLEVIYGKEGAQKMRDVRDLATDLYTSPSGTINASNNANVIVAALDKVAKAAAAIPYAGAPVRYAAGQAARMVESNNLAKRVTAALNPQQAAISEGPLGELLARPNKLAKPLEKPGPQRNQLYEVLQKASPGAYKASVPALMHDD